jgi:hypothetical protein
VDGTGPGSCPVESFGISSVGSLCSATKEIVQLLDSEEVTDMFQYIHR